jgi:hypothetical protein
MNAELNLTASEKIMMLLDGELSKSDTGSLFYEIAQNDELQDELYGHLKLKNLYVDKVPAPPEDLKRRLYAGVGLTGAGMVAASSYIGESTNYVSTLFKSPVFMTVVSAISGALITLFAVNQYGSSNSKNNLDQSLVAKSKIESNLSSLPSNGTNKLNNEFEKSNASYPKVINNEITSEKPKTKPNVNYGDDIQSSFNEFKNLSLDEFTINNSKDLVENKKDVIAGNNIQTDNKIIQQLEIPITSEKPKLTKDFIIEPNKSINKDKYKIDTRFALSFRSFSAQNLSNFDVVANNPPAINNIAIGILYESNENLTFGFEFGQENFLQEFKAVNNQTEINIQQNRLAFWGGGVLTYKLSPVKDIAYMQPYGTLFLGGTNFGFITKQNLGLQYNISDKFAMIGGLEFTSLFSSYNNIWNQSHKYGATYGVILKF